MSISKDAEDNKFDFQELFVLDMANNHQGSVEHGKKIITETSEVLRKNNIKNAAIKFQFRQLDTFIHPDHQTGSDHKYVTRFLSTKMDREGYQDLFDSVKDAGLITMCTPFDEESVDMIVDMDFDLLKIASCSAKDWPLIEKAASSNLPIVFSTLMFEITLKELRRPERAYSCKTLNTILSNIFGTPVISSASGRM